ncbi:hypothetical protein ACFWA6_24660 [Streptomyces sp. NPDC060020]
MAMMLEGPDRRVRRPALFRERLGRVRLAASATVLAGIVLLNVTFG